VSEPNGPEPSASSRWASEYGGPIRVLIVEDHQVVAEALELALGRNPRMRVIGRAGSAAEAVRLASEERPSVVLMDYYLPDATGAEAAAAIRRRAPGVAVVMLSAEGSHEALLASVEAGASGYLLKTQAAAQVVEAVQRAAEGEMLVPAAILAGLLSRQRQRTQRETERERLRRLLTPREHEVLELMARGLDNRAIASRLQIALNTVRGYVQSVLEKLEAHSKLEAVARASEFGLLDR